MRNLASVSEPSETERCWYKTDNLAFMMEGNSSYLLWYELASAFMYLRVYGRRGNAGSCGEELA